MEVTEKLKKFYTVRDYVLTFLELQISGFIKYRYVHDIYIIFFFQLQSKYDGAWDPYESEIARIEREKKCPPPVVGNDYGSGKADFDNVDFYAKLRTMHRDFESSAVVSMQNKKSESQQAM